MQKENNKTHGSFKQKYEYKRDILEIDKQHQKDNHQGTYKFNADMKIIGKKKYFSINSNEKTTE